MPTIRNSSVPAALFALAVLVLATFAPSASARHPCEPDEPEWSCNHRAPKPDEAVDYACERLPIVCPVTGGQGPAILPLP